MRAPLKAARRIYFDRSFGACDESAGIMAPASVPKRRLRSAGQLHANTRYSSMAIFLSLTLTGRSAHCAIVFSTTSTKEMSHE